MNERVLSVVLTVLLVASSLSVGGAGMVSASTSGNTAGNAATYSVQQGGDCYEVDPISRDKNVSEFYDYRPSEMYASHGTTEFQKNQVSNLFVYDGPKGTSLVLLHDELDTDKQDAPYGSTITFNFTNMSDGEWVVRDDNYTDDEGNPQDDNWNTDGSFHSVDWMWSDHRTDGGAFRGIPDDGITIEPGFNEDAEQWDYWPYADDEHNRTDEWRLLGSGGENVTDLQMDRNVTIAEGGCPDEDATQPSADLTADPTTVGNAESVTLDASGSSDEGGSGIAQYKWDFDGDDEVDETTTEKTSFEHTYDSPGDYTASVTVVDGNGNTDTATADVTVVDRSDTNITFVNASAVEVEGSYGTVQLHVRYYTDTGVADSMPARKDVSGTTLIDLEGEYGVNGSLITSVALYEDDISGEPVEERTHPRSNHYAETIKPHPVTVSVQDVTETDEGSYEVTFGYHNPNDESLDMSDSTLSGNVAGEAPEVVEPGENTFTVTWTPETDSERATWTLDRTNFGHEETSASTKEAGEYGDDGSGGTAPDADLIASPTEGYGETEFAFDASGSSADDVAEYEWDFDGDGQFETTTEGPETTRTYSEVGTHEVTVKVVDASGNTDTASTNVTVFKVKSGDDDPPTARLSVPEKGSMSQLLYPFDATDSTDDDEIVKYRWDFDSNGEVEWTDNEDGISSIKPYQVLDEPGTYEVTVTVVDSAGQTDTASATYRVEKVLPNATIHASTDSIEVGEEVTFTAKNFNEAPGDLKHICWKLGDEPGPDGTTWTTSFEESGQKTIKLVLRDRAGYEHVVTKDVTVNAADDGDNGGDDGNNGDDGNDNDKGYENDPNDDNKGGGLPPANPDDGDESNDDDGTVSAPLKGENGEVGQIGLEPAAEDGTPGLEVSQTAPARVEAPSVDEDGFEAVAYVTVTDADSATFTVSKDRLDEIDATAGDVTLFRYDDGTWTAVETEQVGETDDGFEFEANTSDATYAVGIDRPATSVTDLAVETQRVEPGETVTVVATVENDGRAVGTHEVQLTVGGDVVATQTVEIAAGETAEVSLTHAFDDGGVYDVTVDGETAEVVVESVETQTSTTDDADEAETTTSTTTNDGAGVPGFGVSVSVIALVGAALLALRRR